MSPLPRSLMIRESSLKIETALIASGLVATILAGSSAFAVSATTSMFGFQTTPLSLMQFDPVLGTLVGIQFRTGISSYEISVSPDHASLADFLEQNHPGESFSSAFLTGGH